MLSPGDEGAALAEGAERLGVLLIPTAVKVEPGEPCWRIALGSSAPGRSAGQPLLDQLRDNARTEAERLLPSSEARNKQIHGPPGTNSSRAGRSSLARDRAGFSAGKTISRSRAVVEAKVYETGSLFPCPLDGDRRS